MAIILCRRAGHEMDIESRMPLHEAPASAVKLIARIWHFIVVLFGGGISLLKVESGGEAQLQKVLHEKATMPINDLLSELESSSNGLTVQKAKTLLESNGPNLLPGQGGNFWFSILWNALWHPFNLILFTLAIISSVTDDMATFTLMGAMIVLSVGLRFQQELKTSKEAAKLALMVESRATVLRCSPGVPSESNEMLVKQSEIVPGDIVVLGMGDMLPADVRLLSSKDLFVSQSSLTGESLPVEKFVDATDGKDIAALELPNICFMGTSVVSGQGVGIVLTTGQRTYIGSVAAILRKKTPSNAFQNGVRRVSFLLAVFMVAMVPLVIVISGLTTHSWSGSFLFGISVAVGLTPEMLPVIVNANLARGAYEMARRKCIVKRVDAVQNMGAMDILCTDKTGTLTMDNVVMTQHCDRFGTKKRSVFEHAYMNAHFQSGLKNPLDKAILAYAASNSEVKDVDVSTWSMVDEIPFDFERRRLSVILGNHDHGLVEEHHHSPTQEENGHTATLHPERYLLVTKGALEEMLSICTSIQEGDDVIPMTEQIRNSLMDMGEDLNTDGLRVLVVAIKHISSEHLLGEHKLKTMAESDMVFQGFLTFLDPPKESAKGAIHALTRSGVAIKVLTGDNAVVATKVCKELGIPTDYVVTGQDLAGIRDQSELQGTAMRATIFAKLTPFQKLEVVQALKVGNHTIGFLGDGVNDVLALKGADVGMSVDSGYSVAKDAAEIILMEKDLNVLAAGVIRGRITHGNTIKYIKMAASSNFGNVFSILVASAWLPFNPMRPVQILTQNLLYDISQVSIPWDRMDSGYTDQPRTWSAKGIARFMICMGPISSIFDIVTFMIMWWFYGIQTPERQSVLQTAWFIEGLLTQTLVIHCLRTARIPFIQETASRVVLVVTTIIAIIGICIPFTPIGKAEKMVHLPAHYFGFLACIILSYCCLVQVAKTIYIRAFKAWL